MLTNANAVEWSGEMFKLWIEDHPSSSRVDWQEQELLKLQCGAKIGQARQIRALAKMMTREERKALAVEFRALVHELEQAALHLDREQPDHNFIPSHLRKGQSSERTKTSE